MVVPVDSDEHEAEDVDEQARQLVVEILHGGAERGPELERQDRDDDRHHGVAERLEPARAEVQRCRPIRIATHNARDDTEGSRSGHRRRSYCPHGRSAPRQPLDPRAGA